MMPDGVTNRVSPLPQSRETHTPEVRWKKRCGCWSSQIEKRFIIRFAQTIVGWMFILLGIIGVFLPILQGVLFMVIGLMLLSNRYAFARNLLLKAEEKYPKEYAKMVEMQGRIMANKPLLAIGMVVLASLLALGIYMAFSAILTLVDGA
ncbi:MAG: PGPGW domain-containing protein [Gemmatimonadota bacterium]|nr:PGPGW domain-containing protein [Gemmatimonadota bacterium]